MRKKNEIVIKQRASTILTFSLNISTCDLDIFFFSVCVRVCVGVGVGGGEGLCFDRCHHHGLTGITLTG